MNFRQEIRKKLPISKTNLQNLNKLWNKIEKTINSFISLICPLIIQLKLRITEKICPVYHLKNRSKNLKNLTNSDLGQIDDENLEK